MPYTQNPGGVQSYMDTHSGPPPQGPSTMGMYSNEPSMMSASALSVQDVGSRNEVSEGKGILLSVGKVERWVSWILSIHYMRIGK